MSPKWASALEQLCSRSGTVQEYTRMIKGLGKLGLGMKALTVYDELKKHHQPDVTAQNTTLQALAKDPHPDAPRLAFNFLQDMGQDADVVSYTTCITASQTNWRLAVETARCAMERGIALDLVMHGAIVSALARSGEHKRALKWFDSVPPPRSAALYGAAMRNAPWKDAVALLEKMDNEGVEKNESVYNQCIATVGDEWQVALALLRRMQSDTLAPNVRTYNAVMIACRHAWPRALEIFQQIQDPLAPSIISYNVLLDALARAKEVEKALAILRTMRPKIKPDSTSYTAVIGAVGSDWRTALSLLDECRRPDRTCYNAALHSLSHAQEWQRALSLLDSMVAASNVGIDDVSRTLVIACSPWEHALRLLPREPREIPWATAIGVLEAAGEVSKSQELFRALVSSGVLPLQATPLVDLHEFTVPLAKAQVREAAQLHEELILIVGKGHHRNVDTLRTELLHWFSSLRVDASIVPENTGRLKVCTRHFPQ